MTGAQNDRTVQQCLSLCILFNLRTMRFIFGLQVLISCSVASPLLGNGTPVLEEREPQGPSPTGGNGVTIVPPTLNPTLPGFPGGGPTLAPGPSPTRTLGPLPPSTGAPAPPSGPIESCPGNAANARSQWCNYSVDTDYTNVVPNTGRTREYWLTVTELTASPDGFGKCTFVHSNASSLLIRFCQLVPSLPSTAPSQDPRSLVTGVTQW